MGIKLNNKKEIFKNLSKTSHQFQRKLVRKIAVKMQFHSLAMISHQQDTSLQVVVTCKLHIVQAGKQPKTMFQSNKQPSKRHNTFLQA
jgi:hypothetical protein